MSWLRALEIGLDITNVAINLENSERLSELQRLGQTAEFRSQTAELRNQLTNQLRKEIFSYRQAAEAALTGETLSRFRTVVALKLLEHRLRETKITPDDFNEFSDKEYVLSVYKLFSDEISRIMSALTGEEKSSVPTATNALIKHPDYDYYIKKYTDYQHLRIAQSILLTYDSRNTREISSLFLWYNVISALMMAVYASQAQTGLAWVICIVVWVGLVVWQFRWQNAAEYKNAKNSCDRLLPNTNMTLLEFVDQEVQSLEKAHILRAEAETVIRAAFGPEASFLLS